MAGEQASTPPPPPTGSASGDLDSWKEIAAYLRRDVRTVQRWEKHEGLPVHRHLHAKRGTVYAFRHEIDAWWAGRRGELEQGAGPPPAGPTSTNRARWTVALTGIAAVSLLATIIAGGLLRRDAPTGRVMLAVLPFENLSGDPEQEFFSDGLTEELIAQLGRLDPDRLGVIARTSVMTYKASAPSVREIGDALGVDYLLEGTVRREGDRARITAQLVRVSDQTQVWARNYDREIGGILDVQADVAAALAREVRLNPVRAVRRTVHPAAREAYLKGIFLWNRRSADALHQAVTYFDEALANDPEYALALVGMANAYALLPIYGDFQPDLYYPRARDAARAALALDSTLGEAHAVLALVRHDYEWDRAGAALAYRRALALSPNYATGRQWYAECLTLMGRHDEALAQIREALTLDPLSPIVNAIAGWALFYAHRFDAAAERLETTVALHPDFAPAHGYLGWTYEQLGRFDDARAAYVRVFELTGDRPPPHLWGFEGSRASRTRTLDPEVLHEFDQLARDGLVAPYYMATLYAEVGQPDRALEWLEEAYRLRDPAVLALGVDPWFDEMRSDERFRSLLQRVRFVP